MKLVNKKFGNTKHEIESNILRFDSIVQQHDEFHNMIHLRKS